MGSKSALPREIHQFFGLDGGRSLIVKGSAGTGKTTFALQLLEETGDPEKSFYLSTRVSDEALYNQFPWLKEKEVQAAIIDSSRILLDVLYDEPEPEETVSADETMKVQVAQEFLKSIHEDDTGPPTKVDRTRLNVLMEQNRLPEIEQVYNRIEQVLPDKSLLVIDSVEGVTQKYGIDQALFINSLQKDLVENSNTNILFVLEKAEAPEVEYLVDGVVTLGRVELDNRRMRQIHLAKLRATRIQQPNYLMTLLGGRFTTFEPFLPDYTSVSTWEAVPDKENQYSTGCKQLDGLLGGGFRKGSYNVIEVAENVNNDEYYSVVRLILMNFLAQDRGIMAVLSGGDHPKTVREDIVRFMPSEKFDRYVRITDYFISKSTEPYIMAVGTLNKDDALRTWRDNLMALRGNENKPIIDYTGFDTLEYLRGDTIAIRELLKGVASTKISKDLGIGIVKPGLKLTQEIMNMADTYLKIIDVDKCPCLYGIKPKTILHAITVDEDKGLPYIKLTPIV